MKIVVVEIGSGGACRASNENVKLCRKARKDKLHSEIAFQMNIK